MHEERNERSCNAPTGSIIASASRHKQLNLQPRLTMSRSLQKMKAYITKMLPPYLLEKLHSLFRPIPYLYLHDIEDVKNLKSLPPETWNKHLRLYLSPGLSKSLEENTFQLLRLEYPAEMQPEGQDLHLQESVSGDSIQKRLGRVSWLSPNTFQVSLIDGSFNSSNDQGEVSK